MSWRSQGLLASGARCCISDGSHNCRGDAGGGANRGLSGAIGPAERPWSSTLGAPGTLKRSSDKLHFPLLSIWLLEEPLDGKPNSILQAKPLRLEGLLDFAKATPVLSGSAKANLKAPERRKVKVEPYVPPLPPPPNFTFPKLRCL